MFSILEVLVELFSLALQGFSCSGRVEARGKTDGRRLLMLLRFFDS